MYEGANYVDLSFIDDSVNPDGISNKINVLRIENVKPEFLVLKFPKLRDEEFESIIYNCLQKNRLSDVETHLVYLHDSQFFTPYKLPYVKVVAKNHFDAGKAIDAIRTFATAYYSCLDPSTFSSLDKLIFKNSETPFRNLACTKISTIPTFISAKYDIPQIGSTILNMNYIQDCSYTDSDRIISENTMIHLYRVEFADIEKTFLTYASTLKYSPIWHEFRIPDTKEGQKQIEEVYKKGISIADSFTHHLKIVAYDIETYKPLTDMVWDKTKTTHEIITIGFSIFNLNDPKPIRRAAIIPRDFDLDEEITVNGKKFKLRDKVLKIDDSNPLYKVYHVDDYEFKNTQNTQNTSLNQNTSQNIDYSVYYTTKNEVNMLAAFTLIIKKIQPFCVIGFNNWGFDDQWIQQKLKQYQLDSHFLAALFSYNYPSFGKTYYGICPSYTTLKLKFDGEVQQGKDSQRASWKDGLTTFYDAMFCQYKEDTKRFNEGDSKKLENMLKVYGIKSPYEQSNANDVETLAKSGLTYYEMFVSWQNHKQTFKIAHYCLQDAWITGVFAIRKNMISDKIEMGNITHTSFQDSITRADNVRVGNTIIHYAYLEDFAIYDTPDTNSRAYRLNTVYSSKSYDKRTVIGGAVKNKRNGREMDIVAVDFSSMYPSQKEGSNTDTSSRIDSEIIEHPEEFGLKLIKKYYLEDMYCNRWFYIFQDITELNTTGKEKYFEVEEHFAEFKTNPKAIEKIKERYRLLKELKFKFKTFSDAEYQSRIENLYDRLKAELYPLYKDVAFNEMLIKQVCPNNVIMKPTSTEILDNNTIDNYRIDKSFTLETIFNYILESKDKLRLPPTVKVPVYCVQSPKDEETLLPYIHYALKEKLLSDFRAKRKTVKKEMDNPRDATHLIQLSAKEKAIKVVMNSEYGQTGNDAFGWFDSDVAAAVTFASRHCIAECTTCLHTHHFYVDETYENNKFYKEVVEFCKKHGHPNAVRIEKMIYNPFELYSKVFDSNENSENEYEIIGGELKDIIDSNQPELLQKINQNMLNQNMLNQNISSMSSIPSTNTSPLNQNISNISSNISSSNTSSTIYDLIFEGSQRTRQEIQELKNNIDLETLTFKTDKYSIIDFILPPRRLTTCDVYTKLRVDIEKQLINLGIDTSDMTKYINQPFINIYNSLKLPEINLLTMPPSSVVYQDTDSNYYTNETFSGYISVRNPETILEIMNVMISHNNLISKLIPDIIKRPPIGVGFEGAFTVARYLNKKKKYYGKQWDEKMRDWIEIERDKNYLESSPLLEYELQHIVEVPPPKPDPRNPSKMKEFDITPNEHGQVLNIYSSISEIPLNKFYVRYDYKHLPDDYEYYLTNKSVDKAGNYLCKYTTIPFKDGSYMKFTLDDAVKFNLLDFVHYFGIKCTGVDLARRDQFKFINFNHLLTFKDDLRYTPDKNFNTPNLVNLKQVQGNAEKFKLWQPIHQLLLNFAGVELNRKRDDMKSKYEQSWLNWHASDFENTNSEASVFYPWNELTDETIEKIKQHFSELIYTFKDYPLEFFTKIVKYDPGKGNGMNEIINKLKIMINDASLDIKNIIVKITEIMKQFINKDNATKEFINHFNNECVNVFNSISSIAEIKVKIPGILDKLANSIGVNSKYTTGFINEIMKLIENVDKVNVKTQLEAVIPHSGDRVPFVIINPNNTKLTITSSKGDDKYGARKDKGYMLEHLRVLYSDDEIYKLLDYKYYFNQLCKSLCNYLAIEYNPKIADYLSEEFEIEHPDMTPDEIKTEMDKTIEKAIKAIMKPIIDRYYPESTLHEVSKKYAIQRINNVLHNITEKDYVDINKLVPEIKQNIPSLARQKLSINDLETLINGNPLQAHKEIKEIVGCLNNFYTRTMLTLSSHQMINFNPQYLNKINELTNVYENMLNVLSAYLTSTNTTIRNGELKIKVFIWLNEIKEYKKEEARCIYKYEAKLGGNKNNLKGKQIFAWEIPEYVLNTGGKIRYTQRLGELISSYFDLYAGHVDVRFGSGQFSFRKSQNKLFEQVKIFMKLLSGN